MTSIISGIHPILKEPGILDTCSNDPIFLSLPSSFKMVLPIYIALASAVVLLLRGYKQYTYIKLYNNNRYLQYLLEYVPHSSSYNN